MNKEQFRRAVFDSLKNDYAPDRSNEEIKQAMEENQDIIDGCYEEAQSPESFGYDWHAENAAHNIDMCCF